MHTISCVQDRPRWGGFVLVCASYVAVTVGEQLLSPLFPTASDDLGLNVAQGGVAFGLLTASIALANLAGGHLARRWGTLALIRLSTVATIAGCATAATSNGYGQLLAAQLLLGTGAGFFFPAGLQAVATLAGPSRRGTAMGFYGVAFSLGLTLAALLGTLGASQGWRLAFWCGGGLALAGLLASGGLWSLPGRVLSDGSRTRWWAVVGLPTAVGSVGAVCQYGIVPYLALFAVREWGLSTGGAAGLLAVGRVLSIAAKLLSGASSDRIGARASARRLGVVLTALGLGWILLPGNLVTFALAAIFAGMISSLFPLANVLAVEAYQNDGRLLGAYRSLQIAVGAVVGATIGLVAEWLGLRPVLAVAALTPLLLVPWCRPVATAPAAAPTTSVT